MDKAELRRVLSDIPPIAPETSRKIGANLFGFLSARLPGTISTFHAMDDEIDIWSLVDRLPGWNWVLPRIGDNRTMTWWDARLELDSHPFGMKQPVPTGSPVPTIQIDVFLVPGLGFDAHGNRIGRGAGYYDRELAKQRPDSLAIGVTTEARIVDQLPVEPHDRPMTHLVTEFGVRETTPTR